MDCGCWQLQADCACVGAVGLCGLCGACEAIEALLLGQSRAEQCGVGLVQVLGSFLGSIGCQLAMAVAMASCCCGNGMRSWSQIVTAQMTPFTLQAMLPMLAQHATAVVCLCWHPLHCSATAGSMQACKHAILLVQQLSAGTAAGVQHCCVSEAADVSAHDGSAAPCAVAWTLSSRLTAAWFKNMCKHCHHTRL